MRLREIGSLALLGGLITVQPALADDGWSFGIGAGLGALDIDGNGAVDTRVQGGVEFELELDPDDVWDASESGIGVALMARKEALTLSASYSRLRLEGTQNASGGVGKADVEFTSKFGEFTAEQLVARSGNHLFGVIGGARFTRQSYDLNLKANDQRVFKGSVQDEWFDAVVGASYMYSFSPTTNWRTKVTYGFGGSEGTSQFNTGISSVFGESWLLGAFIDIKDVEYRQGNQGDNDWFEYDATESTAGITFMYLL